MIQQANLGSARSLEEVWSEAERIRRDPQGWWAQEFSRFEMVSHHVQFTHKPIPANKWFIDWGMPRRSYGGYSLVDDMRFGKTSRSKLSSALCPKCRNPIFSVLIKGRNDVGYPMHTRRQCILCGYFEDVTVRRDGELEGAICFNGRRYERRFGMKEWLPKEA